MDSKNSLGYRSRRLGLLVPVGFPFVLLFWAAAEWRVFFWFTAAFREIKSRRTSSYCKFLATRILWYTSGARSERCAFVFVLLPCPRGGAWLKKLALE